MIRITDRALVRYLERVHKIDMDAVRSDIRSRVSELAIAAGASIGGPYAIKSGRHTYVCEGETVITVTPRTAATTMIGGDR